MIIYYSGEAPGANPEMVIRDKANLMLSYALFHKRDKPDGRFKLVIAARKHKRKLEKRKHASQ